MKNSHQKDDLHKLMVDLERLTNENLKIKEE